MGGLHLAFEILDSNGNVIDVIALPSENEDDFLANNMICKLPAGTYYVAVSIVPGKTTLPIPYAFIMAYE